MDVEPTINMGLDPEKLVYVHGQELKVSLTVECNSVVPIPVRSAKTFEGGLEISESQKGEPTILKAELVPEFSEKKIMQPREVLPPIEFDITEAFEALPKKDQVVYIRWRVGKKATHWSRVVVTRDYVADVETTAGKFSIEFYPDDAPHTMFTFIERAKKGEYDGAPIFRVEKGEHLIVGDPGKDLPKVKPEPNSRPEGPGAVGMWYDLKPDSATHLFFIRFKERAIPMQRLTIFGQVTQGLETIKALEEVEVDGAKNPEEPLTVMRIAIREKGK